MSELPAAVAEAVDQRFAAFAALAAGGGRPPAPGVAWGVMIGGRLVHDGGLGTLRDGDDRRPGPDSAFRIASMTKSVTSAAVLLLRDDGALRLDDLVARHVPDLDDLVDLADLMGESAPITVRALLSMAAGLPQDDAWADRLEDLAEDAFTELVRGPKTFAWATGTAYEYSNLGYAILGRVVANVAGAPFVEVVRERLLRPLGLTSTTFSDDELRPEQVASGHHRVDDRWEVQAVQRPGAFSPIGGLYSSVRDIAVWMAGFCDAWPRGDEDGVPHPLSRTTRREMQRIETAMPPRLHRDHAGRLRVVASGYCLGLVSEEDVVSGRALGHSGGYPGFGSHMRWHPATGIGVVAFANGRYAPAWEPATEALELLVAADAAPRRRTRPSPAIEAARRDVEQLFERWDDGIVARFSPNVALDEPLDRRRAAIAHLRETYGRLRSDGDVLVETPVRVRWWLAGERGGRVEVAISLTPEVPPRIQVLELTAVPEPPVRLRELAVMLVAAINAGGDLPPNVIAPAAEPDATAVASTLREAAVLLAPCRLSDAVRGDGRTTATFLVESRAGPFDLTVASAGNGGGLTGVVLDPRQRVTTPD